jgi:hypothetical protein
VSVPEGDPQKVACAHDSLRTSAKASENVGSRLWYQAACRTISTARVMWRSPNKAISENSPSKAGVVRRMAISDHCLCVSNPRCLRLLEGDLKPPAPHEPTEDFPRIGIEVRTQEGLGLEISFGIAHQNPSHGHGEQAGRAPHGRRRNDLYRALPAALPVGDLGRFPNGVRIFGYLRKVGQPLALYARASFLPGATRRSRLVEGGVHPTVKKRTLPRAAREDMKARDSPRDNCVPGHGRCEAPEASLERFAADWWYLDARSRRNGEATYRLF